MAHNVGYRMGLHLFECHRCGGVYHSDKKAIEWTGAIVCKGPGTRDCWEPRHPQEMVRGRAEDTSVQHASPRSPTTTSEHYITNYLRNGDFALSVTSSDDGFWQTKGDWTISGGTASISSGTGGLTQTVGSMIPGETYSVTYTLSSFSAGTITVSLGGTSGTAQTSAATVTESIVAGSTNKDFVITAAAGTTVTVDNVSMNYGSVTKPTASTVS